MIYRRHVPYKPLDQFVEWLWYYADWNPTHRMEHVLPDGSFELVIDLKEDPRKLFDRADTSQYTSFRGGWLSGAHSEYIVIDSLPGSSMMGAHFRPGGAAFFFPMRADQFQDQVIGLEAIWGRTVVELRDRLLEVPGADAKLRILEEFLLRRLGAAATPTRQARGISWAVDRFQTQADTTSIKTVVELLGISHKHFIDQFRARVGLTPKLFCRIRRFQEVLKSVTTCREVEWADLACQCGYYDQAHFVHDFQKFAGLNPTSYLSHRLDEPNFVAIHD